MHQTQLHGRIEACVCVPPIMGSLETAYVGSQERRKDTAQRVLGKVVADERDGDGGDRSGFVWWQGADWQDYATRREIPWVQGDVHP